ncbi:sodium:proton antiporter [Alkalihalobacillus sp. MEB130]|uniref:sodium:proton antiporter n=1 Tax=Alkalihalobacillus sp. MEB130 TaxID=2976704 RepID=UPI0028DD7DAE|nr:sodium:proton antiporter [Alkalihalobacillus sp. MEB130]MDT8861727.1 sodium:proton antiporter [Alkalihalobacillus sp. MEB130]
MLQRLISILSLVFSMYFAYKYRYRVINAFLSRKMLRKLAVMFAMQIPFIRDKVLGSVFQSNRPQENF